MKLEAAVVSVRTARPFVIARGGSSEHRVVDLRLVADDGLEGFGEASPNRFYQETPETAMAAIERIRPLVENLDPWALEDAEQAMRDALPGNGSVRSAVSAALHDLAGKRLGVPLYRLWGLNPARAPASSYTIGLAATERELAERVAEAAAFPILKVKLGTDRDAEIIRSVRRAAPDKTLRVDANAAWTVPHAIDMIALLADLGVEFVEQPVAADDIDGLRAVRRGSSLPIIADESCRIASDIPRLAGAVDGINIKLSKCGGLREALRMIAAARAHDLRVMCGCMIETSLGITPAAHLAPLLDHADLDGAALLADDPWSGATVAGGRIALPDAPGLGVTRR